MDMNELLRLLGLRQAYDAYQRNIGQPVANVAGPFGRGLLGLQQPEYGSEEAYRTGQAVGNMPGPNVPAGAIKMAAQAPGLLDAIQAARNSPELTGLLGLTAYHGSPYRFSKFDPTKIGTGEGAQAYGYGHYFAENPQVAGQYRTKLSGPEKGYFYTVDIPDEMIGKMLDWDKPLSKQSKEVKEILKAQSPGLFTKGYFPDTLILGSLLESRGVTLRPNDYSSYVPNRLWGNPSDEMTGKDYYYLISRQNEFQAPSASEALRKLGIPGVRYLDQGSRSAKQGTRNFVIFPGEEEAIKMLKVE